MKQFDINLFMEENLLLENAKKILTILCDAGAKAYLVGGFVRDSIMHRQYDDIDICTSFLPEDVIKILNKNNIKTISTGIKHGTLTAVFDTFHYEVTTFRSDGKYSDNRRPDNVEFIGNIHEDLKRRDFTINAMACNPSEGLIDPFGGYDDIKRKVIRTVGEPSERFKEDALRILRAIRFSSELGFDIDEKTKEAIYKNRELLSNISGERIFSELKRILLGDYVLDALLNYSEIFSTIIPEFAPCLTCAQNTKWHIYNVWQHIVYSVSYSTKNIIIRLTMFFHDIGKPLVKTTDDNGIDHFKKHAGVSAEIAKKILKRFNVCNDILYKIYTLIKFHQDLEKTYKINVRHLMIEFGPETSKELFEVRIADLKAHNPEKVSDEQIEINKKYNDLLQSIERNDIYSIEDLHINGSDLKTLGIKGRQIGTLLKILLYAVADGKIDNEYESLLDYTNQYLKEHTL